MNTNQKNRKLVLAAVFSALIIIMTVIPFTGYITYSPLSIEITTLHIVVTLGAICLGWKYGAVLGGVWGITCIARAFTNPAWYDFINPMISLFPRIIVGLVAGLVFSLLIKLKLNRYISTIVTAIIATLTNTSLVISMLSVFGGSITGGFFTTFKSIFIVLISTNGIIELVAAVLLMPIIYRSIERFITNEKH